MDEKIKLYYEENEIIEVVDMEGGNVSVSLTKEGSPVWVVVMPKWELEACTTKEPSDASNSRNSRAIYVVDAIYDMLLKMNVRVEEISFIMQKFLNKMGGVEQQKWMDLLGVSSKNDIRFSHWL